MRPEGDGLLFCWDTGRRTNAIHHRIPDSLTVTQLRFEEKAGPLTAERALTLTNGAARPIIYFFHPFQRFAFCLPIARNSAWTRDRWHRDPPSNGFPGCLPLTGQHGKPNGVSMSPAFCWRHFRERRAPGAAKAARALFAALWFRYFESYAGFCWAGFFSTSMARFN